MKILMMTNTYTPLVGGLERSIQEFTAHYRKRGHRTIIVAPAFEGMSERERDVVRVPAVPHVRGSPFSLQVPIPGVLSKALRGVAPDVVHAHHPFLVGSTALRLAYARNLPLVFTHHTLFEHYTHLLPMDSSAVKRFVVRLAVGYANLCDCVFAPSQSLKELLLKRGVRTPIAVVPTGIPLSRYLKGDGRSVRQKFGIPLDAWVVGHAGRLNPEKNLGFLFRSVALFLHRHPRAHFLLVGEGCSRADALEVFRRWGVADRLHCPGTLRGRGLVDAYHAMDLFAFSSKSETQGLVILEAMASGIPVAAVKAPGVVDVVQDGRNGTLLEHESIEEFAGALSRFARLPARRRQRMREAARAWAGTFSMDRCAYRALEIYAQLRTRRRVRRPLAGSAWVRTLRWIGAEWRVIRNYTGAAGAAMSIVDLQTDADQD